jgi:FkbM family methyltransferase
MTFWRSTRILQRPDESWEYEFELPRPLADWDVFSYWERERFHSMREHLTTDDTLYDVGTEHGWCSLIYADFVGPENMVLIEPSQVFWPNIRATWERNYPDTPPRYCYDGLIGAQGNDPRELPREMVWPDASAGSLVDKNAYTYLFKSQGVPTITLDDLVERSGVVPTAITMDIEGAEVQALRGSERLLSEVRPKWWISVHPDLASRDFSDDTRELLDLMERHRYTAVHLATDHEQHYYFRPKQ